MIQAPDPLQLGETKNHLKLSFVKEDSYSPHTPTWTLTDDVPARKKRLMTDLNLKNIGTLCAGERFGNGFAYVLANPLTSEEDIQGQRKAVSELSQSDKLETLNKIIDSIYQLESQKEKVLTTGWDSNDWIIHKRLKFLGDYNRILCKLEDLFQDTNAAPLRSIIDYIRTLRESEEMVFVPTAVQRGEDHLRLNLSITEDLAGYSTSIILTGSEYRPKIPTLEILRHLGHRIKAGILFFSTYKRRAAEALKELINHNLPRFDELVLLNTALEFYRAAVNYEQILNEKVQPEFSTNGTSMTQLRHPFTELQGKETVANDYQASDEERLLLVTGANNGGKTFYSKAVGSAHLLAQRGLSIPASIGRIGIVDDVYTHFVDQDDPVEGEGRYKFELRRMSEILDNCTPRSLIIVDEPCGGTDPNMGQVQSSYFLEALSETGAGAKAFYFKEYASRYKI